MQSNDISILYVEDDILSREQLVRLLESQGFHLHVAENGEEGLASYQQHRPDVVLTDIMMPQMSGLEMARQIRTIDPDAQIVVMTAFSDTDFMLDAISIGVSQFVLKPIHLQKLLDALERCRNVVQMRRHLENQREHIRMLSNALEQSPSIAMITDVSGRIEYVNRKFCEVTGYTVEEARGRQPSLVSSGTTPPEQYKQLWETILGGKEWHGELQNRKKSGECFWELCSISPLVNPDGAIIKFIKTSEEITDQKKLEAETLKARKNEAIGILAGGMAHDFNNLLQVILGYISLARMHAESPAKVIELLSVAEKSSEQARALSYRLLLLAKGGEGAPHPVELSSLIMSVLETALKGARINLVLSLKPALFRIMGDDSQLTLVFENIVTNALEAMPQGGELRVMAENLTLDHPLPGLAAGSYVHCSFTDSGKGIAPDVLPRIFDPYVTTKEMGDRKGLGLGLTLCYSIAKKHKGLVSVDSPPDGGATVHIYFPAIVSADNGKAADARDKS